MAENRKAVFIFFILIFSCLFLHAEGEVGYFIANADDETIRNMAAVRGLDTSKSTASLRNTLLEGEGDFESGTVDETEGYSLEIVNAENMDVSRDGLITLSGNVEVIFTLENESSDKTLYADHMLLDGDSGRLTCRHRAVLLGTHARIRAGKAGRFRNRSRCDGQKRNDATGQTGCSTQRDDVHHAGTPHRQQHRLACRTV